MPLFFPNNNRPINNMFMNNPSYITSNAQAAANFSRWFSLVYGSLKNGLRICTVQEEDAFHDTFLLIHQRILRRGDVEGYASYFANAYRNNLSKRKSYERIYLYPEELSFRVPDVADGPDGNGPDDREVCALASDVDRFVKSRFPQGEYELYRLHTREGGFSTGDLSCYTGLPVWKVSRILSGIKKEISQQAPFRSRWRRCISQP